MKLGTEQQVNEFMRVNMNNIVNNTVLHYTQANKKYEDFPST